MYHCACCIPEVESLALMPSLKAGFRRSFQTFGACSGFTRPRWYAIPAKEAPAQAK